MNMTLNKSVVDRTHPTSNAPVYVWDKRLAGFGLKVLPSGRKRYVVQYRVGGGRNGRQRWMTLGTHGPLTCEQAREDARQILACVARGEDPQGVKTDARNSPLFEDLWAIFESDQLSTKKASTIRDYTAQWESHIEPSFGKSKVRDIRSSDIEAFHKKRKNTPYLANRMLALLSVLLSYAERLEWRKINSNPTRLVNRFKEQSRERFLSLQEIHKIAITLENMRTENAVSNEAAGAIKLLLLTGARLNEVLQIKRDWIDLPAQTISLPDSKTGKKTLYLNLAAKQVVIELIESTNSEYLLPAKGGKKHIVNLRKPWLRVVNRAGLEHIRLHDLRHTVASIAVGQGVSLPLIGKLLGHSQPATTQRYAHVDTNPALQAAEVVGGTIGDIVNPVKRA